jgi:arginine N-succinyltransferase
MLIATGRLADYRCTWGFVQEEADGAVSLDAASAARLGLEIGESFTMAGRA